jgi:chemotaxis protein methyltransferase CheR
MTDSEYVLIRRRVHELLGIDLNAYKSTQMRRRLDAYLLRVRAKSWPEYFRLLEQSAEERQRFKDYLTINVTSFFRDADKFATLRERILPQLLDESRTLQIWSAGCSDGAEPYSLAMLVRSIAPNQRLQIWATDIDRSALSRAIAGGPYPEQSVENVPRMLRAQFLVPCEGGYRVKPELQRLIRFQEHNLLRDPVRDRFDLIVCRNVIIYFTEEAKAAVFQLFARSLRPGGFLFIGATETIPLQQARELGLEPVQLTFYRRVEPSATTVRASHQARLAT